MVKWIKVKMSVTQSCPALCDPMDCSLPGFSILGILQVRILGCVTIPFSRGPSQPRDQTWVSCIAGRFFTVWAIRWVSFNYWNKYFSSNYFSIRSKYTISFCEAVMFEYGSKKSVYLNHILYAILSMPRSYGSCDTTVSEIFTGLFSSVIKLASHTL